MQTPTMHLSFQTTAIRGHLHISHNAPYFPSKSLHNLCFSFLLGITAVPREIEKLCLCKILGANKVHYVRCARCVLAQVVLSLCFKAKLSAKPLTWKWFFIRQKIKLIFTTTKVLHLASVWKWEILKLGNGLLIILIFADIHTHVYIFFHWKI